MEPSGRKIDQPWLSEHGADRVMSALAQKGVARFVGGCVRDALLDRPVRDIDIATDLPPEAAMALLEAADIKVVPTGLQHGTITAVADHRPFEVTTLRIDVETDGRRAKVAFTDDWLADAERRDFTFNALYCDADGTVYDPVGGLEDLAARRVRFIGDAEIRIIEDALRILRFFRFHAWFGEGTIDAVGLSACRARVDDLAGLSVERIRSEMLRLLGAPAPVPTLEVMAESGILAAVLPEAGGFDRLARLVAAERDLGISDPIRRLASLLDGPDEAGALAGRWKLSNNDRARLLGMLAASARGTIGNDLPETIARRLIYWGGGAAFADLVLLSWAADGVDRRGLLKALEWDVPVFPVSGADVMAAGVEKGPQVGDVLGDLEAWWVERDFADSREALLERLQELAG